MKKGENLATKEDIKEITRKIESVKAEVLLGKELEKQYLNKQLDLLIQFFDHVSEFHYELIAVNFGEFPFDDGKSLHEYQMAYNKAASEIRKSYQRLVVFITPGSQILYHAEQLTYCVIGSRQILEKGFGKIKTTALSVGEAYLSGDSERYEEAVTEADRANHQYWSAMQSTLDLFKDYYKKYITDLNEYVRPVGDKA